MGIKAELLAQHATITLTQPEALVLFGFLTRYDERSQLDVRDQSEQLILWRLFSALKLVLHDSLLPDAPENIKIARETVRRFS